jgi:anti-sigma factor RsiW
MTSCPSEEVLLDYVAGHLDSARSSSFERHASGCPRCEAKRAAQLAVWRSLEAWEPAPVSEGFNRELWRKIDADAASRPGRLAGALGFVWWKRVAPAVFAAGVLVTVFVIDHSRRLAEKPGLPATTAAIVVSASDADQLESALDDIQLLHAVDTESVPVKPRPSAKKTL